VFQTEEDNTPDKSRERGRKTCGAFDAMSVHGIKMLIRIL